VNFVAHAVVAGRQRDEPAFAFGAMVPDLQRLAREPLDHPSDDLAAGVAAHHRADAAFHESPAFKAWMALVVAGMEERGRGARAAAHVAVELAIDGHLLATGGARSYDDALGWAAGELDGRWALLVDRMHAGEVVDAYATPAGIASRVVGVMLRRPRLAPITPDVDDLAAGIAAARPAIVAGADEIVAAVSDG
jgi:acyl carrier protein phosphodiesterase